ncbi:hypothetical protein VNO80_01074 [Phaseolus coccineus]|uniref:Uncharacterized protein n=1 Tax=Phaseolus coccineus TaxID=3886 RepID=A0AAN9RMI2_PHACN
MASKNLVTSAAKGRTPSDPTVLVESWCVLQDIDERGIEVSIDLETCCTHGYFLQAQAIYPEMVRMFWRNAKLVEDKTIISIVLDKEVVLNKISISEVSSCERTSNCFHGIYEGTNIVERKLYDEIFSKGLMGKKKIYKKLCDIGKIW